MFAKIQKETSITVGIRMIITGSTGEGPSWLDMVAISRALANLFHLFGSWIVYLSF